MSEYDEPWKEALDHFWPLFLAFFFPDIFADIDWRADYEPQDTELQKLAPDGEIGKRLADKLVKVRRKSGDYALAHVELQTQKDTTLPRRTYTYQYRAADRYDTAVVSLVILGDDDPNWRPDAYEFSLWGCTTTFHYRVVKLADWADRLDELERHENPVALLVWAHLNAQRTRNDPAERQRCKGRLIRGLAERGLDGQDMRQWYRFLDWLLDLPQEMERAMWDEIHKERKEKVMGFVTYAERYATERERAEARKQRRQLLLKALEKFLRFRFGQGSEALLASLQTQENPDVLERILDVADSAPAVGDLEKLLQAAPGPAPAA